MREAYDVYDSVQPRPGVSQADLANWFTYHAPTGTQQSRYGALRAKAKELAELIVALTPVSPDQTAAIRKLRECLMTANLSIACNEDPAR